MENLKTIYNMNKKYLVGLLTLALAGTVSLSTQAQEKKKTLGEKIEKTASSVGNKTAEVAVKGVSKVGDKTYKGKVAPDGSDVYINGKNRKYYINKKGAKVYLKASQIKDKPAGK
jgi:streptogramin lyase